MADWSATTFGKLGELFDGPHATPTRVAEGPYFLNISSLVDGRLDLSLSDRVSPEDYRRWTRRVTPRAGDLLFSYETRLGQAALMPGGVKACLGRRMALLRPNRLVVDPQFLVYLYLGPQFQRTIATHTIHGATVPRIGLLAMSSWRVDIPGLREQRAIADVLGALDDKIAANSRVLGSADELIRARFESLNGVPLPFGEVAVNVRRQVSPQTLEATTRYVGLEHVPRRRMWLSNCAAASEVASVKVAFDEGDVLFGKLRPYFHKVVYAPFSGIASTDILVLRPRRAELLGLVLAAAASDVAVAAVSAAADGTRMPRAKWSDLETVMVPSPRDSKVVEFSRWVIVMARLAGRLASENQTLAATRDELLPLLMSGRLRVKDATRVVEEVV